MEALLGKIGGKDSSPAHHWRPHHPPLSPLLSHSNPLPHLSVQGSIIAVVFFDAPSILSSATTPPLPTTLTTLRQQQFWKSNHYLTLAVLSPTWYSRLTKEEAKLFLQTRPRPQPAVRAQFKHCKSAKLPRHHNIKLSFWPLPFVFSVLFVFLFFLS